MTPVSIPHTRLAAPSGDKRSARAAVLILNCALLAAWSVYAQFPRQRPQGYVNDFAGVLSPAAREQLEALCKELDEKTKAQLAIVTVNSLAGRPLEEFTMDLATKWGIGHKGDDRGVMLFLAIQDRKSRIEVGYGLEPIIPDGKAGEILRSMTPFLRTGDYDGALWLGATSIAQPIAQEAGVTLSSSAAARPLVTPPSEEDWAARFSTLFWIAWAILLFGPMISLFMPRRWRRRLGPFGPWVDSGSSGGGWSGSGGGGFGGFGGGSFGGGGASGSW